jgi:D-alanyl-D-alanine carboxypeptidase
MTATMRWRTAVSVTVLALLASSCSGPPTPTTGPPRQLEPAKQLDAAIAKRLDAAIDTTMKAANVPGVIVGLWGPDGEYVRTFGVADQTTGAPMDVDFYHRIGSVTKTFTVTALLELVDHGTVKLDDPIAKYVDGVPRGAEITMRQLARMQSGLPNYSDNEAFQKAIYQDPQHVFSPRDLLNFAFEAPNEFPPGQGFKYSNTNTVLIGLAVETISGQTLPDYVEQHIIDRLKLSHTSFPTNNAFPAPHAQGYTENPSDQVVTATDWDPTWAWAAGAMISSLDDMRVWAKALATGTLLTPETQRQRLEIVSPPPFPPNDGYGLGIFNLAGWIGHNGSLPGYQTVVVFLPEKQLTMVIMSNTDIPALGGEPSTALANAITKVVTPDHVYAIGPGVQAPPAQPSTSPPRPR